MLLSPGPISVALFFGSAIQLSTSQATSGFLSALLTTQTSPPSGDAVPAGPAGHGAVPNAKPPFFADGRTHGPLNIMAHWPEPNWSPTSDCPHWRTDLGALLSTTTRSLTWLSAATLAASPMEPTSPPACHSTGRNVNVPSSVGAAEKQMPE